VPDYGIDIAMTVFDDRGRVLYRPVFFQVKATDSLEVNRRVGSVVVRIDWRDVLYCLNTQVPFALVMYDAQQDAAWWVNMQAYLRSVEPKSGRRAKGTLSVHVPLDNILDEDAIRTIATY
jgi:hypothetical protein